MTLNDAIMSLDFVLSGEPFPAKKVAQRLGKETGAISHACSVLESRGKLKRAEGGGNTKQWAKAGEMPFLVLRAGLYSDKELGIDASA